MHGRRCLGHVLVRLMALLLLGLTAAVPGRAQVGVSLERVIGEVTTTNPAVKQIELKTDAGGRVIVILQDETLYLRVPPGETDLKKALGITPVDIAVGDRVYARGRLAEDQKSILAVAVIVMTKGDLAQQRERERAEWQKRGVAGTISALNPETREMTVSVRSSAGTTTLIIEPSQETVFRRYAPDSVRFGQAQPSSLAELKVGDSLRILGDKNSAGTRIKPEEIVSGSIRTTAGIVNAIDGAAGEIRMTDLQSRKLLTVRITPDTVLRRMPPTKPAATASRPQEGGSGTATKPAATASRPQEGGSGTAPGGRPSGEPAKGATGGGSQMDLERMPALKLGELKRDEAIIVLSTLGVEPSRVTAIVVVAGVESLLGPAAQDQTQIAGAWNFFDISVP